MSTFAVALTGGLASGKTTVLNMFHSLGIETLNADQTAHDITHVNGIAYSNIVQHFGQDILLPNKQIDREKLRHIIFNTPREKKWLENYVHPLIRKRLFEQFLSSTSPYVVVEIPLLAESNNTYPWINYVLVIDCDEQTQYQRAKQRSGLSVEESKKIVQQQQTRQKRNMMAHDILINEGDLASLLSKVKILHEKYLHVSKSVQLSL
ncbi:MAG: dephospho-CoA kinase [Gammaproteobacteria bacterium]|nr:dephospho-CoA kinase [Gammaproteobacteria bacterium]